MPDATTTNHALDAAAQRLLRAGRTFEVCAPVRDLIEAADVHAAYALQKLVNDERISAGARAVGRKIGLTSPAVQQHGC